MAILAWVERHTLGVLLGLVVLFISLLVIFSISNPPSGEETLKKALGSTKDVDLSQPGTLRQLDTPDLAYTTGISRRSDQISVSARDKFVILSAKNGGGNSCIWVRQTADQDYWGQTDGTYCASKLLANNTFFSQQVVSTDSRRPSQISFNP